MQCSMQCHNCPIQFGVVAYVLPLVAGLCGFIYILAPDMAAANTKTKSQKAEKRKLADILVERTVSVLKKRKMIEDELAEKQKTEYTKACLKELREIAEDDLVRGYVMAPEMRREYKFDRKKFFSSFRDETGVHCFEYISTYTQLVERALVWRKQVIEQWSKEKRHTKTW